MGFLYTLKVETKNGKSDPKQLNIAGTAPKKNLRETFPIAGADDLEALVETIENTWQGRFPPSATLIIWKKVKGVDKEVDSWPGTKKE